MKTENYKKAIAAARIIDRIYEGYCKPNQHFDRDEFTNMIRNINYGPETIALIVKRNDWDGRISNDALEWAEAVTSERLEGEQSIYHRLHMCHVDHIARRLAAK